MRSTLLHQDLPRAEHLAEMLKALAHPTRLRIIALLAESDTHVGAIAEALDVNQAIVSQQLRILRMSGLVEVLRQDGHATYRLAEPQLLQMLQCMRRCELPVARPPGAPRGAAR